MAVRFEEIAVVAEERKRQDEIVGLVRTTIGGKGERRNPGADFPEWFFLGRADVIGGQGQSEHETAATGKKTRHRVLSRLCRAAASISTSRSERQISASIRTICGVVPSTERSTSRTAKWSDAWRR
jgi:hypothetical protein